MSQLNVDNLKDRTGANQPAIVGAAKAFVNFDGTGTLAIRESYNVDSITDAGIGAYIVNFTNSFSDANFSAVAEANGHGGAEMRATTCGQHTVSSVVVRCATLDKVQADREIMALAVFR